MACLGANYESVLRNGTFGCCLACFSSFFNSASYVWNDFVMSSVCHIATSSQSVAVDQAHATHVAGGYRCGHGRGKKAAIREYEFDFKRTSSVISFSLNVLCVP